MNQIKSFNKYSSLKNLNFFNNNYSNFSKNLLYDKYSSFKYSYSSLCIKNLIFNEKCRIVSRFKDYLFYDDDTEFLRVSYEKEYLKNTLTEVIDFYEKYNKVFPNYIILPENVFMYKNLRKKQKMIDEINKIKSEKEEKDKNLNLNYKNIKEHIYIFDEKIKENINKQTNTIISNCINNNENEKNEYNFWDNNSFLESNINISTINNTLYSKKSLFNKNDNNSQYRLYDDTIKSEISLINVINALHNKKFKKLYINNKMKNNKKVYKLLNIDIISNNNNNILTNNIKTTCYDIKTPIKNKLFKKEKNKQIYQIHHKSLNNNRAIYNHKKNITDFHNCCPILKTITGNISSKKKTSKFICKFPKEKNIIKKLSTSFLGKYKNKQRNKHKLIERTNLFQGNKKIENLTISQDKYDNCRINCTNISKENKIIKVNNFFTYKRINKYKKNNNIFNYNKIVKEKKVKIVKEKINTQDANNNKIYEIFKEKYKNNFNKEIKIKRKEINKHILDTNSNESTKISLTNKKKKLNFYSIYDKINCTNNQLQTNYNQYNSNNEILQNQIKEEFIFNFNTLNNFNSNNYKNIVHNTENQLINKCSNASNISQKHNIQNKMCKENNKMIYKKHKTYSSNVINIQNDFYFPNIYEENKIKYLSVKLKKIKEELLKNKNDYKEIKEKYRKFIGNNLKSLFTYSQNSNSGQQKNFEKLMTCSAFTNNSVEKKIKNKDLNNNHLVYKHRINDLLNKIKIKINKNIISSLHQRNYSLINKIKSPVKKIITKEITKENKSKDKIILIKVNYKKAKFSKKI